MTTTQIINRNYQILKDLTPDTQEKARRMIVEVARRLNTPLLLTSGRRSFAEQWELRKKHLGGGPLAAKVGESWHNYGRAVDVVPVEFGNINYDSKNWDKIGRIGESVGFYWGGRFNDKPHFQNSKGVLIEDFKKNAKGWQKYEKMERQLIKKPQIESTLIMLGLASIIAYVIYK